MDIKTQFDIVLQSTLEGDNDAIQKAFTLYNNMLINIPEELGFIHFQALTTAKNDQERTLTLILIGRYFKFLKSNNISLSNEAIEAIQNSLLSIFQYESLTPIDFNILSNDIYISVSYFKDKWTKLPEYLCKSLISPNRLVCLSVTNCLANCIYNMRINIDPYFETLLDYVKNTLFTIEKSDVEFISSVLRLFYSLARYRDYKPPEIFISIFNELPKLFHLLQDNNQIINDFGTDVVFSEEIFESSSQQYFELFIKMIIESNNSNTKALSAYNLIELIYSFRVAFASQANFIFNAFSSSLASTQDEVLIETFQNSLFNLSNIYGSNKEFALLVFQYLKDNAPNWYSYAVFGASFQGMKKFFVDSNLSIEILTYFTPAFNSQDNFIRLNAFENFRYIIKDINNNDEWSSCAQNLIIILLNVIPVENNPHVLLKEIKLLKVLLKKFSLNFSNVIENVVLVLNNLIDVCTPTDFQIELFQCYQNMASAYQNNFLPFSEHLGKKLHFYFTNIHELDENIFFSCIEILPELNNCLPIEFFNGLLQQSYQFLFGDIFDENGNENEKIQLSDSLRLRIINFFLSCIEKVDVSHQFIEVIIKIAFRFAAKEIEKEEVNKDSDIRSYENCMIFTKIDCFIIIDVDEFTLIKNSIKTLTLIFNKNKELLLPYSEQICDLTVSLLETSYFKDDPILNDIFEFAKFSFIVISDGDILSKTLEDCLSASVDLESRNIESNDTRKFTANLIHYARIIGNRFKDDFIEIINLINSFFDISMRLFAYEDEISEINVKKASTVQSSLLHYQNHEESKINIALAFRELFIYFPSISSLFFPSIKNVISQREENSTIRTIVFSDFIRHCPQQDTSFYNMLLQHFCEGIQNQDKKIQYDSIYGLAIILTSKFISSESVDSLFNNLLDRATEVSNEMKNMIVFFILQIVQNYSSFFGAFDRFLELFDEDVYLLPKYCIDYLVKSVEFLAINFSTSIPEHKLTVLHKIIQIKRVFQ